MKLKYYLLAGLAAGSVLVTASTVNASVIVVPLKKGVPGQPDDTISRRWPQNLLPYEIVGSWPEDRLYDLKAGMDHIERTTAFRFIERNAGNAAQYPDYVAISSTDNPDNLPGVESGCIVHVFGRFPGRQTMNLGTGCGGGTPIHELMHSMGFAHEQSHPQRDQYITVYPENFSDFDQGQFDKMSPLEAIGGTYDFRSIMHYDVSRDHPTMVPVDPNNEILPSKEKMSPGDIAAINTYYPPFKVVARIKDTTIKLVYSAGMKVRIDGSGSFAPNGAALSYFWRSNPSLGYTAGSSVANFTFNQKGDYKAELKVVDANGVIDYNRQNVRIYGSEYLIPLANYSL